MKKRFLSVLPCAASVFLFCNSSWSAEAVAAPVISDAQQVEQYNFAIHILAMLLVGFGFLMVFVRKYGYSATTSTYLVVAVGLPMYLMLRASGILCGEPIAPSTVKALLFAEFATASALIAMGAVLGRIRVYQYALLAALLVPAYLLNEWLVLDGGLGITKGFVDTAGSIIIHAFGAYFGLGLALMLTTKQQKEKPIESDATSDRFAMLGSMVLWIFWPSFCCAIVPLSQMPQTAVNTILSLCGATLSTYILSTFLRKGKTSIADMANAALAGGVAIGATCNIVAPAMAFGIGVVAGTLSVLGYVFVQPFLESKLKIVDTCGVHNLHGMPGLMGGLIAIAVVPGIAFAQLAGIIFTVVIALTCGLCAGALIKVTGMKSLAYEDSDEFGVSEAAPALETIEIDDKD
ncbi:MAG TPA: ammonium transporter [Lentisphaeria bacterium]|nr:MAG: ammonium transporter [Lentisphaerae bacterium GWF2_50_93]HCE42033.1 ammonium transporter [Lentisphaeria bacterium]